MKDIDIDVGVYTSLTIKLDNFDFLGVEKVIFTIRNNDALGRFVLEREFTAPTTYEIVITPEESRLLSQYACYDFDKVLTDGKRYKVRDS